VAQSQSLFTCFELKSYYTNLSFEGRPEVTISTEPVIPHHKLIAIIMHQAQAVYTVLLSVFLSAFATRSLTTDNCALLLSVLIQPAASSIQPQLKAQVNKEDHVPEIIYNNAVNDEEEVNLKPTILTWSDKLLTSADQKQPTTKIINWVSNGKDILSAKPIMSVKHHTTHNILELKNLSDKYLQVKVVNTVEEMGFWFLRKEVKHIFNFEIKKGEEKILNVRKSGSMRSGDNNVESPVSLKPSIHIFIQEINKIGIIIIIIKEHEANQTSLNGLI
jgi:hypothetical protein